MRNEELVISNIFSIDSCLYYSLLITPCLCSLCGLCSLCCLSTPHYSLLITHYSLLISHSSLSLPRHYPNLYRKTFIIDILLMTLLEFLLFRFIGKKKKRNFICCAKEHELTICSYSPMHRQSPEGSCPRHAER